MYLVLSPRGRENKRINSSVTNQKDFNSNKVALVNNLIKLKSHSSLIECRFRIFIFCTRAVCMRNNKQRKHSIRNFLQFVFLLAENLLF